MLIPLLLSLVIVLFCIKVYKSFNYWAEKGVPYVSPVYSVYNFAENVFRVNSNANTFKEIYEKFPDKRYFGIYQYFKPILVIRDPELIRKITVKDFYAFSDHTTVVLSSNIHELWKNTLFNRSINDGWYNFRSSLTPFFTSSKIRSMYPLMQQCSDQFVNYLKTKNGNIEIEMNDAFSRYANDLMGSAALGVTCDSMKNRNNEFYLMVKQLAYFSGPRGLAYIVNSVCPMLTQALNIDLFNTKVNKFFINLIKDILRIRMENNITRPDMIQLIKESTAHKSNLSLEAFTAPATVFLIGGFETVSTTLAYVAYELAINPDIQEKLNDEVEKTLKNCHGKITHEALVSMKYLDNVISESMRVHIFAALLDRKCTKPYVIEPEKAGEKRLHIEENSCIWIPAGAIHYDPKYFPNPCKFDPDRFNDQNKHKIKPYTYFPFGVGSRMCIGFKFGVLECKSIIVEILRNFKLVPIAKTEIRSNTNLHNVNPIYRNGIWIGLNRKT